ncbi:unnamed protein product [Spirodela intermedia]|uniref:Uncharacterized protein n=1 Tax=Spirodela intermedia TaxID=51605 RepID=A0A7I8JFN8_SPIIN|nr:unnamed protein product [Spirodela intermedia]CAA6668998.1 unnamed protein product [Spirodela intermedia]
MAVTASRAVGFLRQGAFSFFRVLSSSSMASPAPGAAAASEAAAAKKPKRKKKKNLFEVAQFLPDWGIGYNIAKNHWEGISYKITKINLYKDGRHGRRGGFSTRAKISGVHKRGWRYIPNQERRS